MPKPTPEQEQWVERVLGHKPRRAELKRFMDYDRRRSKVEAEIAKMPKGHFLMANIVDGLSSAKEKAEKGAFKGAYQDLESVKLQARAATANYFVGLPYHIATEITQARIALGQIEAAHAVILSRMEVLADTIRREPKVSDCDSLDEAFVLRKQLTGLEANWRGTLATHQRDQAANEKAANDLGIASKIASLKKMVEAFLTNRPAKLAQRDAEIATKLSKQLADLEELAKSEGIFLTAKHLKSEFEKTRTAVEDAIFAATSFETFQKREPDAALKEFSKLDEAEAERIVSAAGKMKREGDRDREATAKTSLAPVGPIPPPKTLAVDDLFTPNSLMALEEADITDNLISQHADDAASALDDHMKLERPGSDVMLDITLRSAEDYERDIVAKLGWDPKEVAKMPQRQKLVRAMAEKLEKTGASSNPNKMADDGSTVTLGGVTYGNATLLGEGSAGRVCRYTGPNGETVAVKSMKDGKSQNASIAKEARAHRVAMGCEVDGNNKNPNVADMKGVVVGKDGTIHMVLEEAAGGDVAGYFASLQSAANDGLISPETNAALMRKTMVQALQGVKSIQEQGLLHLDIKAENFLMAADGTVKLADFGESMRPDDETGMVKNADYSTTSAFAPPEERDIAGAVDRKGEVFWLGSMLQGGQSSIGSVGENNRLGMPKPKYENARSSGSDGAPSKATAFDRLRNAMLDPDPAKRPTIDGLLMSTYLADQTATSFDEQDIAALHQALVDYSSIFGREVRGIKKEVDARRGELIRLRPARDDDDSPEERRQKLEAFEKTRAKTEAEIRPFQEKLDLYTKRVSDEEVGRLYSELYDLKAQLDAVQTGTQQGDADAITQQVADLEKVIKAKQMLAAIARAESSMRTSSPGEFAPSGVAGDVVERRNARGQTGAAQQAQDEGKGKEKVDDWEEVDA